MKKNLKSLFASMFLLASTAYLSFRDPLDNAFFYDRRLQSHTQIEQVVNNSRIKKEGDYAILAFGNGPMQMERKGEDKTLQQAYDALKARGYGDENIAILSPMIPKGRDLNSGITGRLTPENFRSTLEFASKYSGKGGSILMFYGGHGAKDKISFGNDIFSVEDLKKGFEGSKANKLFIFSSCYSGDFIDKLTELKGDLTLLASSPKGKSTVYDNTNLYFWQKVNQGEQPVRAYSESIREAGGKFVHYVLEKAIPIAKNQAVVFNRGKVEIPGHPRQASVERTTIQKSEGLENKLNIFLGIFISTILLMSLLFKSGI
jgi:hypothetical protein